MRNIFSKTIYNMMGLDENIFFLTGDVGYPFLNDIKEGYSDRFINCGAAEQTMFDIAVGLAYSKKYPICYTITPFILRGLETLRTYVDYEKLPMLIVGSGREKNYFRDGISHWATNTQLFFESFEYITYDYPKKEDLEEILLFIVHTKQTAIMTLEK